MNMVVPESSGTGRIHGLGLTLIVVGEGYSHFLLMIDDHETTELR